MLNRRILTLLRKDLKECEIEKFGDFDEYPNLIEDNNVVYLFESVENNLSEIEKIAYERLIMCHEKVENVARELGINPKSLSNAKQRTLKKIKKEINK